MASNPGKSTKIEKELVEKDTHAWNTIGAGHTWCLLIYGLHIMTFQGRDSGEYLTKSIFHAVADPEVIAVADNDGRAHESYSDVDNGMLKKRRIQPCSQFSIGRLRSDYYLLGLEKAMRGRLLLAGSSPIRNPLQPE
ncbi:hypothetical protein A8L59_15090 [Pseudomonas koreensis]|uniref:Uncharacterized protein n=1 Tax=Pseudomonas koreensis TaxID=198620 RepID=A0AAC9BTZ6_9PSED|nr:hypothetical protein A8L59_15090 [Pseudomonas koreensis]